ncbi:MAG: outer membrane beta-barrel protein [Spirochaetota bacterium]
MSAQDTNDNQDNNSDEEDAELRTSWALGFMPFLSYSSAIATNTTTSDLEPEIYQNQIYRTLLSPGGGIGLFIEYPIGSFFSIQSGLYYNINSSAYETTEDKTGFFYLETVYLPLYLKLRWYRKEIMPYFFTGIDIGYVATYISYREQTTYNFEDENTTPLRLGWNIGLGLSIDLGISYIDILLGYSYGLNRDIYHFKYFSTYDSSYKSSRDVFYVAVGYRLFLGNKKLYMPPKVGIAEEVVPHTKPKITINKTNIEKKKIDEQVKINLNISNYDEIYIYLANTRLIVEDIYNNEVLNIPYSGKIKRLPFYVTAYNGFRSFEEYNVYIEATYTDGFINTSSKLSFKTGIILTIDEYGYKRISTSSLTFNEDASLTPETKEKLKTIVEYIGNISENTKIYSLDVGIEQLKDESVSFTQAKIKSMEKFLVSLGIQDHIEQPLLVFMDTNKDDNVPGLVLFDMMFE